MLKKKEKPRELVVCGLVAIVLVVWILPARQFIPGEISMDSSGGGGGRSATKSAKCIFLSISDTVCFAAAVATTAAAVVHSPCQHRRC